FIHAYSLGGGTYTGIESISNGVANMREPRVKTAKRTMAYSAISLAFTASGLLLCYLLWNVSAVEGKTMNAVLVERIVTEVPLGMAFVIVTLISEGALLLVAALAGFVAGPRVLANMAVDSWIPRRFAALSDRLTTQNGILLMGLAALGALIYTNGQVSVIVVMYSINVFLTFSLSMLAMLRHTWRIRSNGRLNTGRFCLFLAGFLLCVTILIITIFEKFGQGGWITLTVTGGVIALCFLIKRHYDKINSRLNTFYQSLLSISKLTLADPGEPNPKEWTAGVLVAGYGGLGLHTLLNIFREFPGLYKGVVFISVGVIDSREYKGEGTIKNLRENVEDNLKKYVEFCKGQGIPATYRLSIGTDAVEEAEKLCLEAAKEFPRITYFVGKVLFEKEKWFQRILHNETAFAIQKRLQWDGKTVVIVPARVK
ncbi:MAG: APC family permease, partial [Candidatus Zixiibacteriota bacterium]